MNMIKYFVNFYVACYVAPLIAWEEWFRIASGCSAKSIDALVKNYLADHLDDDYRNNLHVITRGY
jgi:hypothetical protein